MQDAIVEAVGVDSADAVTPAHLTVITHLSLSGQGITSLKSGDFSGLTALTELDLGYNSISDISPLADLTALENLYLSGNPISDYAPLRALKTAIENAGNSIDIDIDINNNPPVFTEGNSTTRSVSENMPSYTKFGAAVSATDTDTEDTLTYRLGGTDAASFDIDDRSGQLETTSVLDYETKSSYSVTVSVSDGNDGKDSITVTIDVTDVDETSITPVNQRTQQVQDAIVEAVYDVDSADAVTPAHLTVITYLSLSFQGITSLKSGDFSGLTALTELELYGNSISDISPLEDLTALTHLYLGDNSISDVSVLEDLTALESLYLSGNPISDYAPLRTLKTAIENAGNSIYIDIDINNNPPVFTEGNSTTRSVSENMPSYTKIGAAVSATDTDTEDTLTYRLDGTDEVSFDIDRTSGQLETTSVLDYEIKSSYSVTVSVFDGNGGKDSITVTINVTDVDETSIAPVNQRTQQVQDAIVEAVGVDSADAVMPAHLTVITGLSLSGQGITSLKSGDFSGLTTLTYLDLRLNAISDISALDGLTALTELDLGYNSISDISALDNLTALTALDLNGNSIGDISALDNLTALTYLYLGDNSISDVSVLEDLTALESLYLSGNPISDYAPLRTLKTAIENAGNSIDIDIDINNNPPVFTEGNSTTRSVSENMPSYTKFGAAVSATDTDTEDTLTYRLGGTDAASFDIDDRSGQLETTSVLDYETKSSYSVTVSVSDGNDGKDSITVTIDVTDVDETSITPVNQRTQQVQDAIVEAVYDVDSADAVTPAHLTVITYLSLSFQGITSLKSGDFSGLTALTELELYGNSISDISPLEDLTALTHLYLGDNSISDVSVLEDLTALESLYLSGNPISDYAPLRTLKTAIENAGNSIYIDIDINNNPPVFTEGNSTTRSVSENMPSYTKFGAAVSATDTDTEDTLTYRLDGPDEVSFDIDPTSGQLGTTSVLDYETKSSYSVTVSVSDGNGGKDSITVTINVTDVDETSIAPVNQRTQQVQDAIVEAVGVDSADAVTREHLAVITYLSLYSVGITSLKSGDFSGLTALTELYLGSNSISDISPLADLTALTELYLGNNSISDISSLDRFDGADNTSIWVAIRSVIYPRWKT